jgi:teichuronic acid biosynthesis glycosyltransferase TuaG
MNKLVSVIVPYYKKIKYINNTINSVLAQSYKKIEIIIIYDDPDKSDYYFLKKKFKNKKI